MKKILFLAVMLAGAVMVNAQSGAGKNVQFSGGLRLGLPVGNFHLSHSFGVGIELR
jgi:hypothetical protein